VATLVLRHAHIHYKDRLYWLREKVEGRDLSEGYGFPLEKNAESWKN
jgi:hypothetical protein